MFLLELFFSVQHIQYDLVHMYVSGDPTFAAFLSHARRQFETQEHVAIHINHIRYVQFILAIQHELNSSTLHFPVLSLSFWSIRRL